MMRCCEANKLQMRFLKKTKTQKSLRTNNPTKPNKSPKEEQLNKQNKTKQSNNESTVLWFFRFSVCKTEDWR
jgi:hypothetical protein